MHRMVWLLASLTAVSAEMAHPQRPAPPADHWLTMDTLVQALALTPEQHAAVADPYTTINTVMKAAAEKRAAIRGELGGGPPSPEARERFMALREQLSEMQQTIDEQYAALKALLTEPQRAKLDALPKPSVVMPRGRRPSG